MYSPNEQFAELSRATCESALKIAAVSLDKAERFSKLNLQAAKVVLEQTLHNGSAVRGIKDAQGMEALRVKLSELGVQNAIAYSKGVYQIASETQTDFSELAGASMVELCGGCDRVGRESREECTGGFGRRANGVQVGRCRDDCGV